MACEYCDGRKMLVDGRAVDVRIKNGVLIVNDWEFGDEYRIDIIVCPKCGEKLGKDS